MSLRVNYNSAAVRAHSSLYLADLMMSKSMARMSSGIRIQTAGDDPGGLVQANAMRYHLSGLDKATANAEDGISMLQTAEGAMDQVNALLLRLRELALNAANAGANSPEQLKAMQQEFDRAVASITTIAENTQFGTLHLLDGNLADDTLSTEAEVFYASLTQDDTALPRGVLADSTMTIGVPSAALTKDRVSVLLDTAAVGFPSVDTTLQGITQGAATLDLTGGKTVTITGLKGSTTLVLGPTTTIGQFVGMVNATADQTGAQAAYDTTTGRLTIESLGFGMSGLTVASDSMAAGNVGLLDSDTTDPAINANAMPVAANPTVDVTYQDEDGLWQTATLSLDPASEGGRTFTDGALSLTVNEPAAWTVGGALTLNMAAVTATRASTLHFQIGALANQKVRAEIPDVRAGALGHSARNAVYTDLQAIVAAAGLENGGAQDVIAVVDAAITEVGLARGQLGALQSNSLESTLDGLRVSIENLTASESRIRDTDFAAESAEFARRNIILQAATAMLAQANQVPQSVLQLLR